ncbi:hypothetical protein ABVT39_010697 [Epinephelus coioides]
MMCIILQLINLTSCVCGTSVVNVTQTSYQAEENHNITLEWMFTTKTGSSLHSLYIYCQLLTDLRASGLFRLHEGVEVPESQDEQFTGRVQCDKDVLREGRLRLHVSRLRTDDSGRILCSVLTKYGRNSATCRLNVTAAADEPKPQRPTESPQPESPQPESSQPESPQPESQGRIGLCVGLTAAALLTLCVGLCFAFKAHFAKSADKRDHFCAVVEKMMCIILLLINLTSCVCGTFVVNVTQTSYQAEENHNITLEWMFTTKTGSSLHSLYIYCQLLTDLRASGLFHLHGGVEVPESQDEQFTGRVQCDKDVLREGRLRLHVSRLRTDDSGLYMCDVSTHYGGSAATCRLNVTGVTPSTASVTQDVYQAEEHSNITLTWRFPVKTAMSVDSLYIDILYGEPLRTIYLYDTDFEAALYQDELYRGRVQCDPELAKKGRIECVLTGLRLSDTGIYTFIIGVNSDSHTKTCDISVTGTFVVNVTQTSYQAEENHNITLEFTFTTKTGSSLHSLYIYCELLTDLRPTGLFHLHGGVEVLTDEQFTGRVQCDKDVLREGQLRLHVSRLRTDDSGRILCDVDTNYGRNSATCRLNVTAADEPKPQRPTESPQPESPQPESSQPESPQPESPQPESQGRIGLYVGLTAAALLTLCVRLCFAFKAHFAKSADKRDHFCAVV